jgi:putative addiction module component (TIGR02574 family)
MAVVFATVNEQAMQLSPDEKRALIESLVISMDCDPDADPEEIARAWDEEIARRVDAMDRGEVEMIDGDEVFARLRTMLTRQR